MGVQVDEAGDQRLAGQAERLRGVVAGLRGVGGQHVEYAAVLHDDGVVGQRSLLVRQAPPIAAGE